jgi:hypothetical protein
VEVWLVISGGENMADPLREEDGPSTGPREDFPDSPWTPPVAIGVVPRPEAEWSIWGGAKAGLRLGAYVFGPIAALVAMPGLALMAFAAGSGRGWALSIYPILALRIFGGSEILMAILGAMIGMIGALASRGRPTALPPSWWSKAGRPIRLFGKKRGQEPIEARPSRFRGLLWPALVGLPTSLILATSYGFGVYVGRQVDLRLAAAIQAADLDDPSWRIDDLMAAREPVPDAENSALVLARALSTVPQDWPGGSKPNLGEPARPADDLMIASDRLHATPDNARLDDGSADRLRRELEAHGESVRLARTVADDRRGRHELILGPTLLDTRLPETQASRTAARLLEVDAAIRAHASDLDGALDSCRAIIGVARSSGDEPFLISMLVRIAEGAVAMKSARRVLGQGEPSDAALARLQALVLEELAQPLLVPGAKGERATLDEIIRRIREGEMPISALSDGGPPFDPDAPPTPLAPWGRLMFDNQRAIGLEWTNKMVTIAGQPNPARSALVEALQAEVDRVRREPFAAWTATLPILMSPPFHAATAAASRYQSQLGSTAILLAAERHRLKDGDWPGSIAEISPTLLPSAPVDPFTGQPFRMERRDGQFLVYSVGPNGKDEHGTVAPGLWAKDKPDDYGTGAWDMALRRQNPEAERPRPAPDHP